MVIITIGGSPGSGKSTLGRMVAQELGIPFFSMGDMRREYAVAHNLTLEQLNEIAKTDSTSDELVDRLMPRLPEKHASFVIDGRVGYYFLPQSIKLFVRVDKRVGAKRIMDAGRTTERWETIEDGVASVAKREDEDRKRYIRLYNTDVSDFRHYDLVLDSTYATPQELLAQVLKLLQEKGLYERKR